MCLVCCGGRVSGEHCGDLRGSCSNPGPNMWHPALTNLQMPLRYTVLLTSLCWCWHKRTYEITLQTTKSGCGNNCMAFLLQHYPPSSLVPFNCFHTLFLNSRVNLKNSFLLCSQVCWLKLFFLLSLLLWFAADLRNLIIKFVKNRK